MEYLEYIKQARADVKKIAKSFDLKYNANWFKVLFISKREEILSEYVGTCPDEIYMKYGKTAKERINNIDKFVDSTDFKKCVKRYGGHVAARKWLAKEERWYKQIKNAQLSKELLTLQHRIKKELGDTDSIAVLTRTQSKKELNFVLTHILKHEWLHILAIKNKIFFQEIKPSYWKYDEGLMFYFDAILQNRVARLEQDTNAIKTKFEKICSQKACEFKQLLETKESPKMRKQAILNLYKKLQLH
jgi:hypothetical protein